MEPRISRSAWEKLLTTRIAFGHQSVGEDIIEGIADVLRESDLRGLSIVESEDWRASLVGLLHFEIGRNGNPTGKVDHFAEVLDRTPHAPPDIALMKLCYADAIARSDVRHIFEHYRQSLAALQRRYPDTSFVHVTMPLRTVQSGWRVPLKRMIGRQPGGYADNARRHEYNQLLRSEYQHDASFFDLAALESTLPDGHQLTLVYRGTPFAAMAPEYSSDGGHLNGLGRRVIAGRLLELLAKVAERRALEGRGPLPTGTP